ncbi:MAG TPA: glycosyltransferase [Candidatus Polarisedimenticolia bacterium]|nr:glycosyltransferase [Candidatus Polarisedimenticolia bacterium]
MDQKIRIGFVIGQLHVGGYERQLYELVTRMLGSSFEPFVYCLSDEVEPYGTRLQEAGVPLRVIPRRRSFQLSRALHTARLIRRDRIDVVHSWAPGTNFYAGLASLLGGFLPMVSSNWGTNPTPHFLPTFLDGLAFKLSGQIVVNSEIGREWTSKVYGVSPDRIRVIRNWLDTTRFEIRDNPEAAKTSLGLPSSAPVAGFVGRLSSEKGISLFLDVAHDVAARLPESRFLVAGDGPLLQDMVRKSQDLRIADRVLFAGFREDIPHVLAAIDLLVLASTSEGLPNVVLEAMAAGRPVISTRVGGCSEIIDDGATGYLTDSGDREALARRVTEVLSSPDRGRSLGEAGRRRAISEFSTADLLRPMEQIYTRMRETSRQTAAHMAR